MDAYDEEMIDKATTSGLAMDKLKATEDMDAGLAAIGALILTLIDSTGSVRRRLWTKADALHLHAVSGSYFLALGMPWLLYSHVSDAMDVTVPMERSSWFLTSLLLAGVVNALSAIPMSRFTSNKVFDLRDLKANGFTFGGSGLTLMCLWMAVVFGRLSELAPAAQLAILRPLECSGDWHHRKLGAHAAAEL